MAGCLCVYLCCHYALDDFWMKGNVDCGDVENNNCMKSYRLLLYLAVCLLLLQLLVFKKVETNKSYVLTQILNFQLFTLVMLHLPSPCICSNCHIISVIFFLCSSSVIGLSPVFSFNFYYKITFTGNVVKTADISKMTLCSGCVSAEHKLK